MSKGWVGWFRKKNLQPQEFSAGLNQGRDGSGRKISWEFQHCNPGKKAHGTTSGAGGGGVGTPWLCFPWALSLPLCLRSQGQCLPLNHAMGLQ